MNRMNRAVIVEQLFCISIIMLAVSLAGCNKGTDDIDVWIEEVQSRPPEKITELPEIIPYQAFSYDNSDKRDPFDNSILRPNLDAQTSSSLIRPDTHRKQGVLEKFPLDTLSMMGTIARENNTWVLIQTPDKKILRVREGDYLGQNFGQITEIKENRIILTEIIADGMGVWKQRRASIAINQNDHHSFD